jgi:hypothetical protein
VSEAAIRIGVLGLGSVFYGPYMGMIERLAANGRARVTACSLDADKNFSVLERKHVSGSQVSEKLPVQNRYPPIGNEPHEDLAQLTQITSFPLSQSQTTLHGAICEAFQLTNIDADFSLQIPHADAGKGIPRSETAAGAISLSVGNMFLIVHARSFSIGRRLRASIRLISQSPALSVGNEREPSDSVA